MCVFTCCPHEHMGVLTGNEEIDDSSRRHMKVSYLSLYIFTGWGSGHGTSIWDSRLHAPLLKLSTSVTDGACSHASASAQQQETV